MKWKTWIATSVILGAAWVLISCLPMGGGGIDSKTSQDAYDASTTFTESIDKEFLNNLSQPEGIAKEDDFQPNKVVSIDLKEKLAP